MDLYKFASTPLLTKEQEVILAKQIEDSSNPLLQKQARDKMIQSNMRLAFSIAKKYMNKGLDFEDLTQESTIGLLNALNKFDWRKGFKFSTYATFWIKEAILKALFKQNNTVHVPTSAYAIMREAKIAIAKYEKDFGVKPTAEELADLLNVKTEVLQVIFSTKQFAIPLDAKTNDGRTFGETIEGMNGEEIGTALDKEKVKAAILKGLSALTPKEEKIIRMRFGIKKVLDPENYILTDAEISKIKSS